MWHSWFPSEIAKRSVKGRAHTAQTDNEIKSHPSQKSLFSLELPQENIKHSTAKHNSLKKQFLWITQKCSLIFPYAFKMNVRARRHCRASPKAQYKEENPPQEHLGIASPELKHIQWPWPQKAHKPFLAKILSELQHDFLLHNLSA